MGPQRFEDRGANLGWESVLSVSVVLTVFVESAMECQLRVNEVFCTVSLSGTMRSARLCSHSKKTASVIFLLLMLWAVISRASASAERTMMHARYL